MLVSLLSALLLSGLADDASAQARLSQTAPVVSSADAPTDLEDVVVDGRRLRDLTEDFVNQVGQPARGRGLARWQDGICVGVVNLQADAAQYIVDRVSTVAQDIGLRTGAPGCEPSILIVAATNANAFTEQFVAMRPRLFVMGAAGTDLGYTALRRFKSTERPVRWWNVSVPIDSDTGDVAVRLPGQMSRDGVGEASAMQYAPQIMVRGMSRVSTQIVDVSKRTFIIMDMDKIEGASLTKLADYIAMVSLAQVNPDADTSGYATVLNLFNAPDRVEGLTQWDMAYLTGLYDAQRTRRNEASAKTEIASTIVRVHHNLNAAQDAQDGLR